MLVKLSTASEIVKSSSPAYDTGMNALTSLSSYDIGSQ